MSENKESIDVIKYSPQALGSKTGLQLNENVGSIDESKNTGKKTLCTRCHLISVGVILTICVVIAITLFFVLSKKKENTDEPSDTLIEEPSYFFYKIPEYIITNGPLEMQSEYNLTLNVNDLKRIYINQKY